MAFPYADGSASDHDVALATRILKSMLGTLSGNFGHCAFVNAYLLNLQAIHKWHGKCVALQAT